MSLSPDDMVCFALYSATHAIQQAYRPHLEKLGLTYPQYLVMSALWADPGAEGATTDSAPTVGGLGRQLQLDSSTLTPLLKRLEAMGLVVRQRDRKDERQVRIRLSPEGRALEDRAAPVALCLIEASGQAPEELARLRDAVTALRDRLRAGGGTG